MRFEALKKKDEESANTIAKQMKKIQRLQVREVVWGSSVAAHLVLYMPCLDAVVGSHRSHLLQDSISDLKKKMATNTKENEEKTRAIREVREKR